MRIPRFSLRFLFVAIALIGIALGGFLWWTREPRLAAELTVAPDGPLLADFPLILKLSVKNTGEAPMFFSCFTATYPIASPFVLTATDSAGKVHTMRLHNNQGQMGSGRSGVIQINATQTLPAACGPLPPGRYSVVVTAKANVAEWDGKMHEVRPAMQAAPIQITIKTDAAALARAEEDLRNRSTKNDFSRHVATVYGLNPEIDGWLKQLLDDDPQIATKDIGRLMRVSRLSGGREKLLKEAASKHANPVAGQPDPRLLYSIADLARFHKSQDAVDAVTIVAKANIEMHRRTCAISWLGDMKTPSADKALNELTLDTNPEIADAAIFQLARRGDLAMLDRTLKISAQAEGRGSPEKQIERRRQATCALITFRQRPEVKLALQRLLDDQDRPVRESAKEVLEWQDIDYESTMRVGW